MPSASYDRGTFTVYQAKRTTVAVELRHQHATSYSTAPDTLSRYVRTVDRDQLRVLHALDIVNSHCAGPVIQHKRADRPTSTCEQ